MPGFLEGLADFFKALSDPTRLKLIRLLMYNDEDKLKVIDLAEKVGISQPAATQHINILKDLKLVRSTRDQNKKYYFINKKQFEIYKKILFKSLETPIMRCTFKGKCSECPNRNRTQRKH